MNEQKKRGRPFKTLPSLDDLSPPIVVQDNVQQAGINVVAQSYAERVWNGQSPDVPRNERLERVSKALEGQGLTMDGVVL